MEKTPKDTPERKADGAKRGSKRRETDAPEPVVVWSDNAEKEEKEVPGSPKSRKMIVTDEAPGAPKAPKTRSRANTQGAGPSQRRLFED